MSDSPDAIAQDAIALLRAYPGAPAARWPELFERILPRAEDYATVFTDPYVEQAREGFAVVHDDGVIPESNPGQSAVQITACARASSIGAGDPRFDPFPGGYRSVTDALQPDPVWICWKFVRPGEQLGMAHNGLVRVAPGRFAWFPKPWRVLRVP